MANLDSGYAKVSKHNPRTYRIVGPQRQLDERETPHYRVDRGELGERVRLWRKSRTGGDALCRVLGYAGEMKGSPHNSFVYGMSQIPIGAVSPEQVSVSDPVAMARKIKEVARLFGADVVGITYLDQAYVYSHSARNCASSGEKAGDPIHLPHKYAICMGFASDYGRFLACNSVISNIEYRVGLKRPIVPTFMLAAYIREMGYPARAHNTAGYQVNPMPLAVNAGLGELGRHGMLIHEEYGSRLHLSVVTTDLPLAVDEPVDMGVEDVCKVCMKCAQTCPSYSIPFGEKVVINGVEKWAINMETCYKKLALADGGKVDTCVICVTSCCYNKRSAWWHTLAGWLLKKLPIPLRPFYIKPLLWLEDLIWGKKPWRRMKWLDYENIPLLATCTIPGCIVKHKAQEERPLHKIPPPKLQAAS